MKLVVISQGYPTLHDQYFTFVHQLVEQMIDQGVQIDVIVPQSITHNIRWRKPMQPLMNTYTTAGKITYMVYRPKYFSFSNCRGKGVLRLIARETRRLAIMNVLSNLKYDAIYVHFWCDTLFLYEHCLQKQIPLFVACGEGDDALEILDRRISHETRTALKRAVTGVICVSSENKRKCLKYGLSSESNTVVIPNCVNTSIFRPKKDEIFKKRLGVREGDYVISFVGLFIKRKGSRRLADAITKLGDDTIKSIFIGKTRGGDSQDPECNGIIYKGEVIHDKIADYLNASDVFVLPTQNEGCSNAIVEALACGLPVISSDRAFNDDILNEQNSIRVDSDDIDAIADAIVRMRGRKDIRRDLSETVLKENPYSLYERARRIISFIKAYHLCPVKVPDDYIKCNN